MPKAVLNHITGTHRRLMVGILAVAIVPLLALAVLSLNQQREVAVEDAYVRLEGVASAQVSHLERMISADREVSDLLGSSARIRAALIDHHAGGDGAATDFDAALGDTMVVSNRVVNVALLDGSGQLITSDDPTSAARYERAGVLGSTDETTSLILDGPDRQPLSLTTTRVLVDGELLGLIALETDASPISELAADYEGLSATGETSVAQPTPDGAQFVGPLRFRPGAVLNITIPNEKAQAPIILAINGQEGRYGNTVDYRQESVLAVTRHIEATGWGVVVKIDESEALAGVDDFRTSVFFAVAGSVALLLLLSIGVSRSIWKPVSGITATAVAVANGDRSRRADVPPSGELATLATAVNTMTNELVIAAATATDRRAQLEQVNARLMRREQELSSIFDNAVDGIVTVGTDGRLRHVNSSGRQLFGLDDDIVDLPVRTVLSSEHVAHDDLFAAAAAAGADGLAMFARRPDGTTVPVHVAVSQIQSENELFYTGIIRDMSERDAFERQLSHQATHDELTGLPNRTQFRRSLDVALSEGFDTGSNVAVLFLDLDRFKMVNDSRGHAAGDELLQQVAERLSASIRPKDIVARFGGDEFVVLLPDIGDCRHAQRRAGLLHDMFEEPVIVEGDPVHVSCSIGVAVSNGRTDSDEVISDADLAMYRAKQDGRDCTVIFDADMRDWVEDRHQLETALRHAIANDEIEVHYQPIVELDSGEICALEALARWTRPGHGAVSPSDFISVAEESGLIVPLGRSIFRQVCEQQVEWLRAHPDAVPQVTVNISARELVQNECVEVIEEIIDETGAEATLLTIELTETALSSDLKAAIRNVNMLRQLGLKVALDDFGTGYSSLTYLRRFPIDAVKIDRSFMSELEEGSPDTSIVSLVLGLGRNLGMGVIAEGVETERQLAALRLLGCEHAQGYLFAKPQAPEAIEPLVWPQLEVERIAEYIIDADAA